jgi:hypothetical protein
MASLKRPLCYYFFTEIHCCLFWEQKKIHTVGEIKEFLIIKFVSTYTIITQSEKDEKYQTV